MTAAAPAKGLLMLQIGVIALAFGLVFLGELPDKSAIACLVLGTRYPWRWVFAGVAAAFLGHVAVAVAAGSLLTLLPHRALEAVVAVLFLVGAVLVWREGDADEDAEESQEEAAEGAPQTGASFWKVASLGFGVIFLAEWGDLTQILTANLAAKYDDPLSVGIGATLGLWAVALLAMLGGRTLLKVLPMRWLTRAAGAIMVVLGIISVINVLRG